MLQMSRGFFLYLNMVKFGKMDINKGRHYLVNKQNLENILRDQEHDLLKNKTVYCPGVSASKVVRYKVTAR